MLLRDTSMGTTLPVQARPTHRDQSEMKLRIEEDIIYSAWLKADVSESGGPIVHGAWTTHS